MTLYQAKCEKCGETMEMPSQRAVDLWFDYHVCKTEAKKGEPSHEKTR